MSIDKLIEEEASKPGANLSKIARHFDVSFASLQQRYQNPVLADNKIISLLNVPIPTLIKELGRDGFKQHVIAVKHPGREWPEKYKEVLSDARKKFNAGTHFMMQGTHEEGWVIQYLIPRKKPVKPCRFFDETNNVLS